MNVNYTKHALKRMQERSIKKSWIENCIEMPDYNIKKGEIIESHKKIDLQVLKVVWIKKDSFIKVVSVMWK